MQSPRILIVRLSAIGDVIQSMPIACALRERFPQAFLAWAVEEHAGQLLQGHEALDRLITLPRGWLKSPGGVWRLRRLLHDLRFDVAIEAQGLTKAAILAWLSGAPRRIGFGVPWGRELSRWFNTETVDTPGPHIVQRNLQLLRPAGHRIAGGAVPRARASRRSADGRADHWPRRPGARVCDDQCGGRLAVEALARRSLRRRGRASGRPHGTCRRWWSWAGQKEMEIGRADRGRRRRGTPSWRRRPR